MWIFRKNASGPSSVVRGSGIVARRLSAPCIWSAVYDLLIAFCFLLSAFYVIDAPICFCAIPGRYEVKEIKPHIFIWVPDDIIYQVGDPQFERAGTAGFIITQEGVVVVNTTNNPFNARELLYEIRQRTDKPVKYVINTDARGDHMLGNEVFVDQQATIISTSVAQAEMRVYQQDLTRRMADDPRLQLRMRGIHPTLSTQTFAGELTLRLGGEEIKLLDLGRGASAGDAAVYLPGAKVLFLGDLYENGYLPRRGMSDVRPWLEILRQVESLDVVSYIPGQGPPGDKNDFQDFRRFLEWVAAELQPSLTPETLPSPGQVAKMAIVN
jgi:glyoxylase-like metal-dependent hydrolase (beta-lactamase superfamily II)